MSTLIAAAAAAAAQPAAHHLIVSGNAHRPTDIAQISKARGHDCCRNLAVRDEGHGAEHSEHHAQ